jgi:hypothetical protein
VALLDIEVQHQVQADMRLKVWVIEGNFDNDETTILENGNNVLMNVVGNDVEQVEVLVGGSQQLTDLGKWNKLSRLIKNLMTLRLHY